MPSSRRCVFGCVTKGLTVHSFPNPSKFPEQFRIWVELGGEQLKNLSVEEIRRLKVCDKHFIASHRNRNSRLNALAIPTLHLSQQQQRQQKQQVPDSEIELQTGDPLLISSPTPHSSCAPMTCKTQKDKLNNTEYIENNSRKENIQEEIVIEMNVPAKSKERWKLSRVRHNKSFKRLNSSSRDGAKTSRSCRDGVKTPRPRREGAKTPRPCRDGAKTLRPCRDGAKTPRPFRDGAMTLRPCRDGAKTPRPCRDGAKTPRPCRDGAKRPGPWRYEKQRLLKQLKCNLVRRVYTKNDSNSTLNPLCSSEDDVHTISYIASSSKRKDVEQKYEEEIYLDTGESQVPRPSTSNAVHSFFTAMADIVVTFPPDVQLKIKNQLYSAVWQAAL